MKKSIKILFSLIVILIVTGCAKPQVRVQNNLFNITSSFLSTYSEYKCSLILNEIEIELNNLLLYQYTDYVDINDSDTVNAFVLDYFNNGTIGSTILPTINGQLQKKKIHYYINCWCKYIDNLKIRRKYNNN